NAVVPGLRRPSGPSSALRTGTPKLLRAAKLPSASWIFWSVFRAASSSPARTPGVWWGLRHGWPDPFVLLGLLVFACAVAGAAPAVMTAASTAAARTGTIFRR